MRSLYEINLDIIKAEESCIDMETGEILADTSALDALMLERDEKVEGIGLYIKNLRAEAQMVEEEEKKLRSRREQCRKRAERLQAYLQSVLAGEKFKTANLSISYRKSEAVVVPSIDDLDEGYLRFKEPEADKKAIRDAIKAGITVKGASLEDRVSMIIK